MPSPIYAGTRIVVGIVTFLIMLQILRPLLQECPYGSCLFPQLPWLTIGDPCAPNQPCGTNTCYSYEYAPCPAAQPPAQKPLPAGKPIRYK
ncbi:MAG: hypothetical protein AAGF75_02765 [Cyanobacteria bacterium P01_H01_bin.130]